MKQFLTILLLSVASFSMAATDSLSVKPSDSLAVAWKPNPYKSVWLGAIVPGLGQIYNRAYWKLPIVYGGLMGCGYAIGINQQYYQEYKNAYRDITTDAGHLSTDPTKSYNALIPEGYTLERLGGESGWTNTLKERQNTYRRYRDISIVATIVVYALTLVDAYVDAQLFDFDISEDLSVNVQPELYLDPYQHQRSAELHLAISF